MENSLNDELLCSLKDELREVTAQINVHSEKLMDLLDQKKESSSTDSRDVASHACHHRVSGKSEAICLCCARCHQSG